MATTVLSSTASESSTTITHQSPADLTPSSDQILSSVLSSCPHTLLQPPLSVHTAALVTAKRYIDPVAISVSNSQAQRLHDARRKRKRSMEEDDDIRNVLRMKQVHLEGFTIDQVWEQARRVLEASRKELEGCIPAALHEDDAAHHSKVKSQTNGVLRSAKIVRFDDEDSELGSDHNHEEDMSLGSQTLEARMVNGALDRASFDDEVSSDEFLEDGDNENHGEDIEDIEEDPSDDNTDNELEGGQSTTFVEDRHGLNDGFFSIDDFNKTSELLEQQDARGDPDDGAASDEEEVDWEANPLTRPVTKLDRVSRKHSDASSSSDEEDGPTFGDADLNAPFDISDEDQDNVDIELLMEDTTTNTNDIHYTDFFAPPPQPAGRSSNHRRRQPSQTQPPPTTDAAPTDADIQRTISSVHRDIFSDTLSNHSGSDAEANLTNLSTHERRRAALASQIRELEAAAIAKREWTLSGEALASARPLNSLLEEDLDFERTGKPVPVVTAAVSASIEEMIKTRILARNFDEVHRRRPGTDLLNSGGENPARRGLVELDDRKNNQGLAEIYETEHARRTDPAFVDKRDEKLKAAHASIEKLWADVSAKLDALSSWHYRPKPPALEVSVVSDAAKISMENARPAGVGIGDDEEGRLAPQEVYKVGGDGEGGSGKRGEEEAVVITSGGGVVGKEELTREQKLRRRRREKERLRKKGDGATMNGAAKVDGSVGDGGAKKGQRRKAKDGTDVVGELKRGGVKIIGKGGEMRDVEGKKVKTGSIGRGGGGGGFKL